MERLCSETLIARRKRLFCKKHPRKSVRNTSPTPTRTSRKGLQMADKLKPSDIQLRLDEAALRLLDRAIPDKLSSAEGGVADLAEAARVFDSVMKYFSPRLKNPEGGKKRTSTIGKLRQQLDGRNPGGGVYSGSGYSVGTQASAIPGGQEAEEAGDEE